MLEGLTGQICRY